MKLSDELLGGGELDSETVAPLERLLPDARLSPASYRAVIRNFPVPIAPSLRALQDAVVSLSDRELVKR